jgi:Flp pilus assembly pilin Flp
MYHYSVKKFLSLLPIKNIRNDQSGQTAIEYVLLLVVVSTLVTAVAGNIKEYFLADAGNCTAQSKSLVCTFETQFEKVGLADFRYFTVMR